MLFYSFLFLNFHGEALSFQRSADWGRGGELKTKAVRGSYVPGSRPAVEEGGSFVFGSAVGCSVVGRQRCYCAQKIGRTTTAIVVCDTTFSGCFAAFLVGLFLVS